MADNRKGTGRFPAYPSPPNQGSAKAGGAYEQPGLTSSRPASTETAPAGPPAENTSITKPGSGTSGDGTTARTPKAIGS